MIAHIILYSPRPDLTEAERGTLAAAVSAAFSGIPSIQRSLVAKCVDLGYGYTRVGEMPYEFAAIVEFEHRSGLAAYLEHPLHAALAEAFWRSGGRTLVMDVEDISIA